MRTRAAPSAAYLPAGRSSLCLRWRMTNVLCCKRACHDGLKLQAVTPASGVSCAVSMQKRTAHEHGWTLDGEVLKSPQPPGATGA
jgi:hypothetical protein